VLLKRGSSIASECQGEGLLSVWNCPGGWSCGQSHTSCKRSRFLTTCHKEAIPRAHAPIFFPSRPEVSSLVRLLLHSGHFHRRKLLLWGITSARYMSCLSSGQLTRGVISCSIVFASFVSMKYPVDVLYRTRQPGSRQAYSNPSAGSRRRLKSISV
jgi:hypothetical protein